MTDSTTPSNHGGSRAGAGRPKGSPNKKPASVWTVQVRMDGKLEARLKEEAAALGLTPAAFVRQILEERFFSGEK